MADFFDALTDAHADMIRRQPVFFTATAAAEGRINLSPKGYDSLRILSPTRVATLDLAGSGNETQAHLAVDGRITIMVCNWEPPALILRIYGTGRAVMPGAPDWDELGPALHPAAGHAPDLRYRGGQCADQLRLGRAADDAGARAADPHQGARPDATRRVAGQAGRARPLHGRAARGAAHDLHRPLVRRVAMNELIELARFPDGMEAAMAAGLLGSHGIVAQVFDGGMNIADSAGLAIPTRVMVRARDHAQARAILEEVAP